MKKGTYNLFFGILNQLVLLIVGLLVPKLFIENLGSEVNGLIATINQIFGYINLLEAGIGAASLQALYSPLSNSNTVSINGILSATHKSYQKTALYYFLLIIALVFIYPFIVTTGISNGVIRLLIILMGMTGVINFLFQGKYKILLQAEGKSYVLLNIDTMIAIVVNLLKVFLIVRGYNILLVQSTQLIINIFQLIFIEFYIRKNYPWLNFNMKPDFKAISQSKSVFVHQITGLLYNNTDMIILMLYTNLKLVSVYAVYNSLTTMVLNIIFQVSNSVTFLLGKFMSIDRKKLIVLFNTYEIVYVGLSFAVISTLNLIIMGFMSIYTAGMDDANYMDSLLATLFLVKIGLQAARTPYRQIIEVAGHFKKTQNRAMIETASNLILSLILINYMGIYGIMLGTVISLLYRTIDMIIYSNKVILNRKIKESVILWAINIVLFLVLFLFGLNYSVNTSSFFSFVLDSLILTIVTFLIFAVVNVVFYFKKIKLFLQEFNIQSLWENKIKSLFNSRRI